MLSFLLYDNNTEKYCPHFIDYETKSQKVKVIFLRFIVTGNGRTGTWRVRARLLFQMEKKKKSENYNAFDFTKCCEENKHGNW